MFMHWLIAHLIGDYILQNDAIARRKKINLFRGLEHVSLYILPFFFCNLHIITILLIFVQHWLQDSTDFVKRFCLLFGKFQFDEGRFWGHIIIDNVLHILFMYFVIKYVDPLLNILL